MIGPLLRRLGFDTAEARDDTLDTISTALDALGEARARLLAAFAYLLSRAANADHVVTPEETLVMEQLVREQGSLPTDQAAIVVRLATRQNAKRRGTADFLVSREFNEVASEDEKRALIRCLFAVCGADHRILTSEDNEIRQIARELRIEHAEFIRIRSEFRDRLEVLKPRTPPRT
jgi:uncharacterized tellurite resistance protein B-like protein